MWDVFISEEGGPGDTTPVDQYSPGGDSPYGVADTSGNVWEWCADWCDEDEQEYQRRAGFTTRDPQGPEEGIFRVMRGGSFFGPYRSARCANRGGGEPDYRDNIIGFRLVMAPGLPSGL